jgi:ubiquinone/menaquinone biosynthesis C-methylase UbiE
MGLAERACSAEYEMLLAMDDAKKKELSRQRFNRHVSGYEATLAGWHSSRMKDAALRRVHRPVDGPVLDVGCGPGILLATLAGENPSLVLAGIDLAPEMIRAAQVRLGARAELRVGDAEDLPWDDGQFGVVTCIDSFHHYPKPARAMAEMFRVLKPGGLLVIADPWAPPVVRHAINLFITLRRSADVMVYGKHEMMLMLQSAKFERATWETEGRFGFVVTAVAG